MNPVKLGVLGVSGHYGLRLRNPLIASPLIELTAIGSRSLERSQAAAKDWGFSKAYGSYDAVLADEDVEAVYIPLPNDVHAHWIRRCADAGKAVLCEKPLAMDAQETADALAYAADKGVLVMEAFMYRFHPQWVRAKELVRVGEIGEIQSIQSVFTYNNPDPKNIRNQLSKGGGALMDIGCYTISSARFLFGREPLRVLAYVQRDPVDGTDINTSAILDFGGARCVFTVSTRTAPQQRVVAYGSKGHLEVELPFNAFPDVPLKVTVDNGLGPRDVFCGPADQYALLFEEFARAYREGREAATPPTDALANMKVIDAVFRSAESGNWEPV